MTQRTVLGLWLKRMAAFLVCASAYTTAVAGPIPQHLTDLYEIFADEIRPEPLGNVYGKSGNRFQLDGDAYSALLRALNAYDLLHGSYSTELEDSLREEWLPERHERAREAFAALLKVLPWPRLQVVLTGDIAALASGRWEVLEQTTSPVLLHMSNNTGATSEIRWRAEGMRVPGQTLRVITGGQRYALGFVDPTAAGSTKVKLAIRTSHAVVEKEYPLQVAATGVLEGSLEDAGPGDPIARIRVTDHTGRHRSLEAPEYGLILRPETKAERWEYAEERFRVVVPAGPVNVAIRRGLEYVPIDEQLHVEAGTTTKKRFRLERWVDMERLGWYSGDTHTHWLSPSSALFEMRAENLRVVEILALKHMGVTISREHFRGGPDPVSDERHIVYVNEEYRNQPLGHVGLLNLKRLVEPISTGGLAAPRARTMRYFSRVPSYPRGWMLPRHGEPGYPDSPLLLEVMRETHRQGGVVNWAHLRSSQWEFPVDAVFGELDTVDILTHTRLSQALELWYHLLNCGFRLPATAGTDREAPQEPVGHQRLYVRVNGDFSYSSWIDGLRDGRSFVTNGPMVRMSVDGQGHGAELKLPTAKSVTIEADATSYLPFERLDLVINGEVVHSVKPGASGRAAKLTIDYAVKSSSWIAVRCMGTRQKEFFASSHPLFAHSNPVYVDLAGEPIRNAKSGCYYAEFLKPLEKWVEEDAYFESPEERQAAMSTIRAGAEFYRQLCSEG